MRLALGRFGPLTHLVPFHGPLGIDWLGRLRLWWALFSSRRCIFIRCCFLNLRHRLQPRSIDGTAAANSAHRDGGSSAASSFRSSARLFAGLTLVLISSFTELGTPLMFSYYTITPVQVFHQITDVADNPLPYALVVVMLIASSLIYSSEN